MSSLAQFSKKNKNNYRYHNSLYFFILCILEEYLEEDEWYLSSVLFIFQNLFSLREFIFSTRAAFILYHLELFNNQKLRIIGLKFSLCVTLAQSNEIGTYACPNDVKTNDALLFQKVDEMHHHLQFEYIFSNQFFS